LLHEDGSYEVLEHANTVLGLLPGQRYFEYTHCVQTGDLLLLYTDGITEATRGEEEFGIERLAKVAQNYRHLPAAELVRIVYQEVRAYAENPHLDDDCTTVAIKLSGY
jgi:serine phosphatase RsbU (regulator of sigma subunit)